MIVTIEQNSKFYRLRPYDEYIPSNFSSQLEYFLKEAFGCEDVDIDLDNTVDPVRVEIDGREATCEEYIKVMFALVETMENYDGATE